jgi:hypothetical protein
VHLVAAMLRGGFTHEEARKITGGNHMRIFRAAVGRRLQPSERCLAMKDISGKTAIVTGAASGIGLGIATALAEPAPMWLWPTSRKMWWKRLRMACPGRTNA